MTKTIILAAIALAPLAACTKADPPTTENAANATEAELLNRAEALNADVNAEANAAAAAAMREGANQAQALDNKVDAAGNGSSAAP